MKGCTGILKRRIENREVLLHGCIMDCRSGAAVEMYKEIGYDVVLIDREHTALNHETILEHIRLCRALEISCMVRVAEASYSELNRIMDQAPDGIYIPRIRNREELEEIMKRIKFPPKGCKGLGGSTCPAGKYLGWEGGVQPQIDFYSNDFVVGIQIETAEAFADLDGILSVPGVDIAIVGNDDLSLGLGIPGRIESPEYTEAVKKIIESCRRHNVYPGIAGGDPAWIKYWYDQGMRGFWAASDIVHMWLYTKQSHAAIMKELGFHQNVQSYSADAVKE